MGTFDFAYEPVFIPLNHSSYLANGKSWTIEPIDLS